MQQADREELQRRTIRVLTAAQVFAGAGFFLGFAVSALLAGSRSPRARRPDRPRQRVTR